MIHPAVAAAGRGTGHDRGRAEGGDGAHRWSCAPPATWWSPPRGRCSSPPPAGSSRPGGRAARRRTSVISTPTPSAASTGVADDDQRAGRAPSCSNAAIPERSPTARPMPRTKPITEATSADDRGLGEHRAGDLPARGADGAHQGELLGALGDQHGEGVGDQEDPDEERDAREAEQHLLEASSAPLDVLGLLVGERLAGLRLGGLRQQRLDRVAGSSRRWRRARR